MGRSTIIRMDPIVHPVNQEEILVMFIEDWNKHFSESGQSRTRCLKVSRTERVRVTARMDRNFPEVSLPAAGQVDRAG